MRRFLVFVLTILPYLFAFSVVPRYNQPYMRSEWYLYGCGMFSTSMLGKRVVTNRTPVKIGDQSPSRRRADLYRKGSL